MTNKHYDTDWAKAKSRDLVGKMLDETLLSFRKPSELRVLHFGGIDLAEARQVYLPRGILPKNIVSIERDKTIAQEQMKQGTGIQVLHTTLDEYLEQKREIRFDVLSLDYIGPVTYDTVASIMNLTQKNQGDRIILHTANLMSRDGQSLGCYQWGNMNNHLVEPKIESDISNGIIPSSLHRTFQRFKNAKNAWAKDEERKGLRESVYQYPLYAPALVNHHLGPGS